MLENLLDLKTVGEEEVRRLGSEFYDVNESEGEVVIQELEVPLQKAFWAIQNAGLVLSMHSERKFLELLLKSGEPDKYLLVEANLIEDLLDVFRKMFWLEVRRKLPPETGSIGIRKGWKIVVLPMPLTENDTSELVN